MTDRLKQISLRKFREQVADLWEVVEVSKRDADGNIRILGYWTPYATHAAGATELAAPLGRATSAPGPMVGIEVKAGEVGVLDIPVEDESFPMGEDSEFDRHPRTAPRIIATPEEAAVAVKVDPVRAVPKPSQRRVKR